MTDLTKLADELRAAAYKAPDRATSRAMFEAAHIIRSAASLDMTGFMAMHDAAAEARRVLVSGGNVPQAEADRSRLSRAALESALRMALAAREWQPIETAPKDERILLLVPAFGPWNTSWWPGSWSWAREQWAIHTPFSTQGDRAIFGTDIPKPIGWMPLPAAAPKGTP